MSRKSPTSEKIIRVLSDGRPRTSTAIAKEQGISGPAVWSSLKRCWKAGLVLRSENPITERTQRFRGRHGLSKNTRSYYLYMDNPKAKDGLVIDGKRYVPYSAEYLDKRGAKENSKAQHILRFLREHYGKAFFSRVVYTELKDKGVKIRDVMATVRRYDRFVYIRGYRTDAGQTPFKEGYLLTWIDQSKDREAAIGEAVKFTDEALRDRNATNPVIERMHAIRDRIIESSKLRELTGLQYLQSELGLTEYEAQNAADRALILYLDLKEVRLFNTYRYFYHVSLQGPELDAAIALKENYIRKTKGRYNRIGHNWEAVPEWFIDTFTTGARFWTQEHRAGGMDPRRITIHLMKPVGNRRQNAEVDRVWEVTPGVFANPITYVLECKWGLVKKKYVDDFFEVLRWSKEFGVDTPEGRQVRQGVLGVFAASSFDPKENVIINDESISLPAYAARMNIQLLKAADFNEKLRERGVDERVTTQSICRASADERQVRDTLEAVWKESDKAKERLDALAVGNAKLFEFERMLKGKGDQDSDFS